MIYSADITTPANTSASSPLRTRIRVTKGLVYQIQVYQPSGPLGLCYVQIWDGTYQAWPSTPGSAFRGDGFVYTYEETYLKYTEPWEFEVKSWNLDTSYEHLTVVQICMVSEEIFMARFLPTMTYDKMLEALQQARESQEAARKAIVASPFPWLSSKKE